MAAYKPATEKTGAASGRKVAGKTGAAIYKPAAGFVKETGVNVLLTLAAVLATAYNIPIKKIGAN